jgi:NADH dehydrogenase
MKKTHIVIVGGGFGGLAAAKRLASRQVSVTLFDKKNYHLFQPLLYQVATGGLSPAEIAFPLRSLLSNNRNITVHMEEVKSVNKEEKYIETETSKISFDYLILACGSTYTYFNSPQWEEFAPGLKTIKQATEIRRRIFLAFENAEKEKNIEKQKSLLTFVVVGGGPTGVELAGAIGEITRYTLKKDFRSIKPQNTRIILVEAGQRILPSFTEKLSLKSMRQLEELGVQVWLNSKVTEMNETGIRIGNEFVESTTILWAAGVAANSLNKNLNVELDRQGRIVVGSDVAIKGHPSIFVIGDQAHFEDENKNVLPGLAPVAMQQGRFVTKVILDEIAGKAVREKFVYVDKGQMATIGRSRAVLLYKGFQSSGFFAWIAWLFVHIYYLIGFKNRFFVFFQWAWTYFTYSRGARLIVEDE